MDNDTDTTDTNNDTNNDTDNDICGGLCDMCPIAEAIGCYYANDAL